jgi:predicted nucleic acid-binding protein
MLIDSDLIIAYMKREDRLKDTATAIFKAAEEGRLTNLQASSEVLHELYYVFSEYAPLKVTLANEARLASMQNMSFIDPTRETYLSALNLMETYGIKSVFDAIYAATTLTDRVPDHTILSTDEIHGKVKGIERIDPRTLRVRTTTRQVRRSQRRE